MTSFLGVPCVKGAPTKAHRPAIWEVMLGTVCALSPAGEARCFDYDFEAAKAHAGIASATDARLAPMPKYKSYIEKGATWAEARPGQRVLWVK